MNSDAVGRARELAASQHGVISRSQAGDQGLSDRTIRTMLRRGAWSQVGRALVVLDLREHGDEHMAWVLRANIDPGCIITGPLAARLQGWEIPGEKLLVISSSRVTPGIPGVRVLRRGTLPDVVHPGLRLAVRQEALVDSLITVTELAARDVLDRALQRRWVNAETFGRLVESRAGRGRRGVRRLRDLQARAVGGTRSEAESRMAGLLRRSNSGPWIANHPLRDQAGLVVAELDFAHLGLRIAIEVDGRAFHSDRRSFEHDRRRQNALSIDGWLVLRFTWERIVTDPQGVIREIQAAVAARSSAFSLRFA